jgi:effector-binding domain-containing protein
MAYVMIEKDVPSQHVGAFHVHAAFDRVGEQVADAFEALGRTLGEPAGMPFLVTWNVDTTDGTIDLDVCWPTEGEVVAEDGIAPLDLPAAHAVTTVHRGPYAEVGPAYASLERWIEVRGVAHAGPPREVYLNDPREVGEDRALTEIVMPVS